MVMCALSVTQAINMNTKSIGRMFPIVSQEEGGSSEGEGNDTYIDPEDIVWVGNNTNALGFEFKNYTPIEEFKIKWGSFMLGARALYYSPNITTCFDQGVDLYQYDLELLMIKYMYGNAKQNTLNTTLFARNISDMSYICIDAMENLYVYNMYKYDLFGRDNTNVVLGALQNLLGNILTINSLYGEIREYSEANDTVKVYYEFGRIFRLVMDIEPVVLEEAGYDADEEEITYAADASPADSGVWGSPRSRPLVKATITNEDNTTEEYDTRDYVNPDDINLADFDWSFGLYGTFPGLKYLAQISGPLNFTMGFLNGTQFTKDPSVQRCESIVQDDYITNAQDIVNMTSVIWNEEDTFVNIYNMFDQLLLITKITQQLHPIAFHCWAAGENVYAHFYDIIAMQNGYNPKNYVMNSVYNFGHIFDNLRDVILYFTEDPRGQTNSVHDAGYNLGLATFYFITPDLAFYDSPALEYEVAED